MEELSTLEHFINCVVTAALLFGVLALGYIVDWLRRR